MENKGYQFHTKGLNDTCGSADFEKGGIKK
jgi:hypothetical protein